MPLTKLQFKPGINRETTSYSNEGGWFDSDKVRFRMGFPEKIGGWVRQSIYNFLGTCRALHPWVTLSGDKLIGVGTSFKYYINEGGSYHDITPIRIASSAVTFAAGADTLNGAINNVAQDIILNSVTGFPTGGGLIKIGTEQINYAGITSSTLTGCVRGVNGTTAASHSNSASVTCATLTVTDPDASGAVVDDFVTFSGAASLGGVITATVLNQEYQVTRIINANIFQIEARSVATIQEITTTSGLNPTFVFANTSDSGNGGASAVGDYQINVGLDTSVLGTGWGAGVWGGEGNGGTSGTTGNITGWGDASDLTVSGDTMRIWSHDNFGEDLLINVRDGGIYYWNKSSGLNNRAVLLSGLANANRTPTIANQILVSDKDRHIIAFGCDPETNIGTQDPLLIRFSSQESLTDWAAETTNTAGDLRLGSGSKIILAVETRQQILVFTDVSLHAMQFLGPPFVFGINTVSENITTASPMCAVAVNDSVFWMGRNEFYVYSGAVERLPCTVRDYVFSDFNEDQIEKVSAATNSSFSEVWWFYPSASSEENDRYVVFNYAQQIWYYGALNRTFWIDRGVDKTPVAASSDHYLYNHEVGFDDGSTVPASAITSRIESSQMSLGDGDQFAFLSRIIPDITFRNSTTTTPAVTFTLGVRNFPGGQYLNTDASSVGKTSSVPVEQFTTEVRTRLRGRSFNLKIESTETEMGWRLGTPRVEVRPDGRR
tara:strand:+ start:1106 stop:3259 length:2154 start_codon:yes stop_codon:yes gene_type:complete